MKSGLPPSRMSVPRPAMLVAIVTAPFSSGLRNDLRLTLVILRVENVVRDFFFQQPARDQLRVFN